MSFSDLLQPFDKYFLYLMIIHCFLLIFIDTHTFNKNNNSANGQKSKTLGYSSLVISVMVFLFKIFL